jgi:Protein of unknown function (DUF3352)
MTDLDPMTDPRTTDSPYEPAADAAPATPVQSAGPQLPRRSIRWPIALAVVALVMVATAAVAILITGRAPNAKVLGYVPDGTVIYGEARLDLPGDQRMALASFLSKFPGFADQSAIEGKLNEVMDRFIGGVTNGSQTYTSDLKPWFDGELAFSVGPLPDPSAVSGDPASGMNAARFLILVSVKDEAGVTAWFKGVATSSGATMTDEAYNGVNLTLLSSEGGQQGAYAVLGGKVAIVGDVDSVKAAVDTKGSGPFAAQADAKAALDATDADHVGFVYVALAPLLDWSSQLSQANGSSILGLDLSTGALRNLLPDWEAFALRIEDDALVLEAAVARPATAVGPTENRSSTVTDHVPASALLVAVGHDYGASLVGVLNAYRSEPALKSVIDGIDQAAGVLGGTEGAIGWIGDTGLVVNQADAGIEAGLVIVPTDRAAAERTFTSLRTLIALGGAQAGITVTDAPHGDATITTIDLGDISALAARAGIPLDALGNGSALPSGHVELAFAITDQVVVIGSGPEFVKHVLDTTGASSIATTDRFKALNGRVGNGTGIAFVDIAAIRGLIESALASADPSAVSAYQQNVQPFLAPFDSLIASGAVNNGVATSKVIITVK